MIDRFPTTHTTNVAVSEEQNLAHQSKPTLSRGVQQQHTYRGLYVRPTPSKPMAAPRAPEQNKICTTRKTNLSVIASAATKRGPPTSQKKNTHTRQITAFEWTQLNTRPKNHNLRTRSPQNQPMGSHLCKKERKDTPSSTYGDLCYLSPPVIFTYAMYHAISLYCTSVSVPAIPWYYIQP